MSDYTREQVIEMVKNGESLEGTDLSGIDLSEVDFRSKEDGGLCEKPAILNGANLEGAIFNNANLNKAELISVNLSWASINRADLSKTNISYSNFRLATLYEVNLSGAKITGVDFLGAKLTGADIRKAEINFTKFTRCYLGNANLNEADLSSTDFENSDLNNADISGTNIYRIKRHGWKIDGIKCTHVYQCPDRESWNDEKKREKYRRDFALGEFEALYRTLPQIELIFQQGFTPQDLSLLTAMIEQINQRLPSPLDMSELKKGMSTTVSLTAENNKILKSAIPDS